MNVWGKFFLRCLNLSPPCLATSDIAQDLAFVISCLEADLNLPFRLGEPTLGPFPLYLFSHLHSQTLISAKFQHSASKKKPQLPIYTNNSGCSQQFRNVNNTGLAFLFFPHLPFSFHISLVPLPSFIFIVPPITHIFSMSSPSRLRAVTGCWAPAL